MSHASSKAYKRPRGADRSTRQTPARRRKHQNGASSRTDRLHATSATAHSLHAAQVKSLQTGETVHGRAVRTQRSGQAAARAGQVAAGWRDDAWPRPEHASYHCRTCGHSEADRRARVQVKALKNGETVQKPIYNHVSGELDPAEPTSAPKVRATLYHGSRFRSTQPLPRRVLCLDAQTRRRNRWRLPRVLAVVACFRGNANASPRTADEGFFLVRLAGCYIERQISKHMAKHSASGKRQAQRSDLHRPNSK